MPRALLLENIHPLAAERLRGAGFEVETRKGALTEAELADALTGVSLLGIRSQTQLTAKALEAADDLLAVGAFCIGTNQIDLAEASSRGVAVFNAPFSNTRSVVELALAEVIALTRRLPVKDKALHAGTWAKSAEGAHEVRGRTLGIVGYGNIGSQLSVLAESLGMRVLFYDVRDRLALGNARRVPTLSELLGQSDVVTLHVDGRSGNRDLFGAAEFAAMKPGAIFLNLSRGFVVDHDSLREHLESGHLAGAAIDVFPTEPKGNGAAFESVLRGLDNVILTPHIGGSTEEAQEDIGRFVSGKLADYVGQGTSSLSVNFPTLDLPEFPYGAAPAPATAGAPAPREHRVAHLHENAPGVLAALTSVLATAGVNIDGQYLATRGQLGYVVTDVNAVVTDELCAALRSLPGTVKVRVLS
ncbi:MAG TPA: phosphoglycerate dehydrogenase [Motilibacteraceae bacterium]|nr:phosphoglycerate dehydrogenase [Motilibacteraceae bacterium]